MLTIRDIERIDRNDDDTLTFVIDGRPVTIPRLDLLYRHRVRRAILTQADLLIPTPSDQEYDAAMIPLVNRDLS